MEASDFTAALDDYRQYLRRKQEAEQLRQEFDTLQAPGSSSSSGGEAAVGGGQQGADAAAACGAGGAAQKDFSLKPGETIHIKLSPVSSSNARPEAVELAAPCSLWVERCYNLCNCCAVLCCADVVLSRLPCQKRGDSGRGSGSVLRAGSGGGGGSSSPAAAATAAPPGAVPRLSPPGSSSSSGGSSSGFFRLQPPPPPPSGSSSSNSAVAAAGGTGSSPQRQLSGPARASLDTKAAEVAEDDWGDFVG